MSIHHLPQARTTPDADLLARVALGRVSEPEDGAVHAEVAEHGPVAAWERIRAGDGRHARFRPRVQQCDPRRDLHLAERVGARVVTPESDEWPTRLDELEFPPLCLWVIGPLCVDALGSSVAIVGSRNATSYGLGVASELAAGVASRGWVVVSGAAYGIDAAAHRGALAVDAPTVAFVAGGVDRMYPVGNEGLIRRIRECGAVVSEISPGSAPMRNRFVARNRLIAAITSGTVVVEGSVRSGSLSTANRAGELGRPVGAVPGPITSAESAGTHHLVRNRNATLITEAADVVEMLAPIGQAESSPPARARRQAATVAEQRWRDQRRATDGLDDTARRVLDQMPRRSASSVQDLVTATTLPWALVRAALSRLDVAGLVRQQGEDWRVVRGAD